jgi:hypothetical protein
MLAIVTQNPHERTKKLLLLFEVVKPSVRVSQSYVHYDENCCAYSQSYEQKEANFGKR